LYPLLYKYGDLAIHTYGVFMAAALVSGLLMAEKEARRQGQLVDRIRDMCFYAIIAAMLGSRLSYVFLNPALFKNDPLEIFRIWNNGLDFYGGFLGAGIATLIYIRVSGMPCGKTLDILAPSLAVGQFVARIGCFFAGCCHGKVCERSWAVIFTSPEALAPTGIPLHPTQLYHASGNLMILIFLLMLRKFRRWDGLIFWSYVMLYGLFRTTIDSFRGDVRLMIGWGNTSVTQVIGMSLAVTAFIVIVIRGRRAVKMRNL